jgi:ribonuclease HI
MSIYTGPQLFWVTLYCDASFSGQDGGAWGVWLKSEKGRIQRRGRCPKWVRDALEAEFYAAEVGIRLAVEEWQAQGVQVNSDCMAVVTGLGSGYRWSSRKSIRQVQDRIFKLGARIRTKHVKAHTGGQDTRSYLNRQVDRLAGLARRGAQPAPSEAARLPKKGLFVGEDGERVVVHLEYDNTIEVLECDLTPAEAIRAIEESLGHP